MVDVSRLLGLSSKEVPFCDYKIVEELELIDKRNEEEDLHQILLTFYIHPYYPTSVMQSYL